MDEENLPRGLVSTSGDVSAELDALDLVDIGDIVQLWRAYSTNPSVHEGDAGFRLQNFFWRLWGSERLTSSMTGSTLARLFLQISEPSPFTLQQRPKIEKSEPLSPSKGEKPPSDPPSSGVTKAPLPPILKKSKTSSSHGEIQKTTRLLLTGLGGQAITRMPANSPTPLPSARPVAIENRNRQSQKKTFAVASKGKIRRRPVLMRRKSSQQSSVSSTRCSTRAHSPQSPQSPQSVSSPSIEFLPGVLSERETIQNTVQNTIHNTTQESEETSEELTERPNITLIYQNTSDDPPKQLPPAFLAELKELLSRKTPLPPLRPRITPPVVGFFSSTACRRFDVRYLMAENYEKPSAYSLVGRNFRSRFAERLRWEQEYYEALTALGDGFLSGPGPIGTESAAATELTDGTTSPSRFGDSQGAPSTVATSIQASNDASNPTPTSLSTSVHPLPSPPSGITLFPPTPFSLPRGPSLLSILIEQSRREGSNESNESNEDE